MSIAESIGERPLDGIHHAELGEVEREGYSRTVLLLALKWDCSHAEAERRVFDMELHGEVPEWGLMNCEWEPWYRKEKLREFLGPARPERQLPEEELYDRTLRRKWREESNG